MSAYPERENHNLRLKLAQTERERDGLIGRNQFLSTEVLRLDILRGAAEAQRDELELRLQGAGNAQDLAHFRYAELQAQRDELVEALEQIVNAKSYVNAGGYVVTGDEAQELAIKRARAALAKHRDPYGPIGHPTC